MSLAVAVASPAWDRMRRHVALLVLLALGFGIFAYPGTGGLDPRHTHIVIGGTAAERARALARHLLRERAAVNDAVPFVGLTGGAQGLLEVLVYSIRQGNNSGPALVAVTVPGGALAAAHADVGAPSEGPRRYVPLFRPPSPRGQDSHVVCQLTMME